MAKIIREQPRPVAIHRIALQPLLSDVDKEKQRITPGSDLLCDVFHASSARRELPSARRENAIRFRKEGKTTVQLVSNCSEKMEDKVNVLAFGADPNKYELASAVKQIILCNDIVNRSVYV